MNSKGNRMGMSLKPPRAFPSDGNQIMRKSKENKLEDSRGISNCFLDEVNRQSKENEPEASKGIS